MAEREKPRANIFKKIARFVAVPVTVGISMASVGCAQTTYIQFPDCKTDPQIKHVRKTIADSGVRITYPILYASIDGVVFKKAYGRPGEIELSGESHRLNIIRENERYQLKDRTKGRSYDIAIVHPTNKSDSRTVTIEIEATCPPKK